MKQIAMMVLLAVFSGASFGGVIDDAEQQIAKDKQERMVSKAKTLLEKKAKLEIDLADVKKKLTALDNGDDVEINEHPSSATVSCCYATSIISR